MHTISHNLKKVAQGAYVHIVFSAPKKLEELCKLTCPINVTILACDKRYRVKYVDRVCRAVYKFLLSCSKYYIR